MKEVPITQISPLNNCAIRKGLDHNGRPAFIMDVEYRLEDGRTFPGTVSRQRKKDVPQGLARAQQSAAAKAFFAIFDARGDYFGTCQKWTIGATGLNPVS